jgi:hypothetical protein
VNTVKTPSVWRFVLLTLLWLPSCFVVWYLSAPYHSAALGVLTHLLVNSLTPDILSTLTHPQIVLVFVTNIEIHAAPGMTGMLMLEINPLDYTYGLAFFVALMLAAQAKLWKILAGVIILLPFQSWGIAFDFLVQIGIKLGDEVSAQTGLLSWHKDAIGVAYQLGYLIFPSLLPVMLWAIFNAQFIESLQHAQITTKAGA